MENQSGRYHPSAAIILAFACLQLACKAPEQSTLREPLLYELSDIEITQSAESVESYDFVEVTFRGNKIVGTNPFTDVFVSGYFGDITSGDRLSATGFCDAPDGSVFRIRFMPSKKGDYAYTVNYWRDNLVKTYHGTFRATDVGRKGILAQDPEYRWHFIWRGTGEHYFLNGTTAFLLMGWDDEQVIQSCIDRLTSLGINRIRVLLDGRTDHYWTEPIQPGNGFRVHLEPWPAKRPEDVKDPGFDLSRFNCPYWQKFERMLSYARERDVVVSVVFGWNDTAVHPAAMSSDEFRYFAYAIARLAAFSNVTWDLGDDLDAFRSATWTHAIGTWIQKSDPYHHLATSHPIDNRYQDRYSDWFGMTSFQKWERPLHGWMLEQRRQQAEGGRIIPQVNEEYGFEDHYTRWAPYKPPAASTDANRRAAWEISMAGCYQTTGETAKRGTGISPDTGGGWVNGRGDDTMVMLKGYAHMVRFFTSFEWWKVDPHDELVNGGAFCLAEPNQRYIVYLPHGGNVEIKLGPGRYENQWFNPRTGEYNALPDADGPVWTSPVAPDQEDWVLTLVRRDPDSSHEN